jgi:hypothetical protein
MPFSYIESTLQMTKDDVDFEINGMKDGASSGMIQDYIYEIIHFSS